MITDSIKRHAVEDPEKVAIVCGETKLTYHELNSISNKIAFSLSNMGIKRGDKVSFLLMNSPEFPLIYYALIKLGGIGIPLNTRYQAPELEFVLNHAETETFIYDDCFDSLVAQVKSNLKYVKRFIVSGGEAEGDNFTSLMERGEDVAGKTGISLQDEMIYFYTSGTTGDPKGTMLTYENCISSSQMWIEGLQLGREDRIFVTTPLWHCSATTGFMLSAGTLGATLLFQREYKTEEVMRMIQDEKVNFMWVVPTIMVLIQEHPKFGKYDFSSLEKLLVGGAPLSFDTIKKWKDDFPNLKIFNGYAQTEGATAGSMLLDEYILSKPNSIGKALADKIEIRVVKDSGEEADTGETGEIWIKGPNVMKGYFKNPELTKQTLSQGWLHTGDLGHFDEEGFVYYDGRKKDLIKRGGEGIFPEEIEEALVRHPSVLESAVIGVPDKIFGEQVLALVVLRETAEATEEEIIDFCKGLLADYKVPKYVKFVQALPKNPTGKVLKKILRKQFEDFPQGKE